MSCTSRPWNVSLSSPAQVKSAGERAVWGYQALRPLSASCILTASQRAAINWQRVAGLQLSVTQHSTWDTILCRMVSWLDSCSPTIKLIKTRVFSPASIIHQTFLVILVRIGVSVPKVINYCITQSRSHHKWDFSVKLITCCFDHTG